MKYDAFQEVRCWTADELWDKLSPTKSARGTQSSLIYRGVENTDWKLIPSALRQGNSNSVPASWGDDWKAHRQIFVEAYLLNQFVESCDQAGIRLPNASMDFRKRLNPGKQVRFFLRSGQWPSPDLLEFMALAQHHGVPTRLLAWTSNPYAAVYFAASKALANVGNWTGTPYLAIWELDTRLIYRYKMIQIVEAPVSISRDFSDRSGLFTVHFYESGSLKLPDVACLEDELSKFPATPLKKYMLPVAECRRLYELCKIIDLTGATISPSEDGAGRAVTDHINYLTSLELP